MTGLVHCAGCGMDGEENCFCYGDEPPPPPSEMQARYDAMHDAYGRPIGLPEFDGVRVERGMPTGDYRAALIDRIADQLGVPQHLRHLAALPGPNAMRAEIDEQIQTALRNLMLDIGAAMERQALMNWADAWDVPLSALCEAHAHDYGLAYYPDIIRGLR